MKKFNFLIFVIFAINMVSGQTTIYDPFVGVITLSPNSPYSTANPPFTAVNGTATFSIAANTGTDYEPISWGILEGCTAQACKLVVTVSTTVSKTIITAIPTTGTFVGKFDWVLNNQNLLTGTQRSDLLGGDINPGTSGNIIVPIRHIASSTVNDPIGQTHPCDAPGNNCTIGFTQGFNGVVVNLQPPSQPSNNYPASLQADDNNGAYVYARTSLPIQSLDLSSIAKQLSGIQVLWKTLNESNTKEFEIQRLYDGNNNNWTTVGNTKAAGYSQEELTYDYIDKNFAKVEKIYYRVKQIDMNGVASYTNIKSIQLKEYNKAQLTGFPNPVNNAYHLSFNLKSDAKIGIELIDILGKSISRQSIQAKAGYNIRDIDFSGLSTGTYIVKIAGNEINDSMTVLKVD